MSDSLCKKFVEQYSDLATKTINAFKVRYTSNITIYGKIPNEIIDYYFELSTLGKMMRGALVYLLVKDRNEIAPEVKLNVSVAMEFFHTAILIHDDVIDNSELRRSIPTMNIKFGVNQAICAGDYGFYLTHLLLQECGIELKQLWQTTKIFDAYAIRLIQGQMAEIETTSKPEISLNRIFEIYHMKSGQYTFEMPLIIGYTLAGLNDDEYKNTLRKYAYYTGIIFQIIDDYLDIFGEITTCGKPTGNDLREGKPTLFAYYLKNSTIETHKNFIFNNLGKNTPDNSTHNLYRTYLEECGAIIKAKDVIETYSKNALKAINSCAAIAQTEVGRVLTDIILTLKSKIS